MRRLPLRPCLLALASIGLLCIAGCGPQPKPTGTLSGTVTFEGEPVESATIQIQSSSTGEAFATKVGSGGTFQFERPVTVGEYTVSIIPEFEVPVAGAAGANPTPIKPPERTDIPEKYRVPTTSGLTLEVNPGSNTYEAAMKK